MNGRFGDPHGKFTCVKHAGSSTVDYVLCKCEIMKLFKSFEIEDPNILSDHCIINFSIKTEISELNDIRPETPNENHERIEFAYKWNDDMKHAFLESLSHESNQLIFNHLRNELESVSNPEEIDICLTNFNNAFNGVCDPFFRQDIHRKSDKNKAKDKRWYDNECKQKQHEFYKDLNIYRNNKIAENRINMVRSRAEYKTLLRHKKFNFDKKQTKKLEQLRYKNAKEYWKLLKSMGTPPKKINISTDTFANYFKAINNPESTFFQPDEDTIHFNERFIMGEFQSMFEELDFEISDSEILRACTDLKNNRSGGPDYFINEFFKYGILHIISYLNKLFNKLLNTGYFPSQWSEGFIVPLHKKGDPDLPENYRGITLLSTLGKLFSRILNTRLNKWAESYQIYVEAQAGFREQMGTMDNIFVLHGLINHLLNENKKVIVCFVDFTKAFDYVVRENVWLKLIKYGVRGKFLNVLRSMYSNVKSRIKTQNMLSESFICTLGVRQGDCLSPFLFSLYLNDLEETFMLQGFAGIEIEMFKLFILLYADDIVIFSENLNELNKGLSILKNYCEKWKLVVSVQKTKIMIFQKGGRINRNVKFMYGDTEIEIVRKFTYLGIVFTTGGSFCETFEALSGQALKAIYKLKTYLQKLTDLPVKHVLDLFDKLILPILNYGCEVWGINESKKIENVHLHFCKNLLGVRLQTQNSFIYGELGRTPLKNDRIIRVVKYWFKLLKCDNTKYVKKIYNMMLNDIDRLPNKKCWAKSIKTLFENLGFYYVWFFQGVGNENILIEQLKQRLKDTYRQHWGEQLDNSTRASSYRLFADFSFKLYLETLTLKKYRFAVTRLRLSAHRLAIETGRWHKPNKIPRNERKCLYCHTLEDEFHFLLECSLFKELRTQYIKKYFWKRPNIQKFVALLSSENYNISTNLALFIAKAFEKRNHLFY